MLFKKFLMPCGLCAAVPAMKPVNPQEEAMTPCNNEAKPKKLIKPSELPIYSAEDGYSKEMPCLQPANSHYSVVEENIRKVRQSLQGLKVIYEDVSQRISNTVDSMKFVVDYLQDQSNTLPRAGAVGIGGLSGLLFGLRGGIIKRLLYTTTGAGIIGAVCFPKETKEAFNVVEHYGNIGYNFIYGVKPGDNKQKISLKDSITDSEFFQMLAKTFELKSSETATEKTEKDSPANKSEEKKA